MKPGSVVLLTERVVFRDGRFNLVFRGDLEALSLDAPKLQSSSQEFDFEVQPFKRGTSLYLNCQLPDDLQASGDIVLVFGEFRFHRSIVKL